MILLSRVNHRLRPYGGWGKIHSTIFFRRRHMGESWLSERNGRRPGTGRSVKVKWPTGNDLRDLWRARGLTQKGNVRLLQVESVLVRKTKQNVFEFSDMVWYGPSLHKTYNTCFSVIFWLQISIPHLPSNKLTDAVIRIISKINCY